MKEIVSMTMKDLAAEMGVSVATVSRALKDSPRISKDMRQKIQQYARDHNFTPNVLAESLRHSRVQPMKVIGVIVPELVHYYFMTILKGIEEEAEARGLFSVGYNVVRGTYSDRFLTAALYDWNVLYKKVLEDYLKGGTNFSRSYWLGLMDHAVTLYPLSPAVSPKAAAAMEFEKGRIMTEWDVFSGQIYDNEGGLRCDRDEWISDEELFLVMDWYVEGVELYE